jgi:hypothetical protein
MRLIWETGNQEHNTPDGHYYALEKLCGREYATEAEYLAGLVARRPSVPAAITDYLMKNSDLNELYIKTVLVGSEEVEGIHNEVKGMLAFTDAVQKHLKANGLSSAELAPCEKMMEEARLEGVGQRVGDQVMAVIRKAAAELGPGERILITSDVIESLNGSWKMIIGGSPTPALGGNALVMAGLMGTLSLAETKLALETVRVEDVSTWTKETYEQTFHQERLKIRRRQSPPNMGDLITC